jgi:hypothetical protein
MDQASFFGTDASSTKFPLKLPEKYPFWLGYGDFGQSIG